METSKLQTYFFLVFFTLVGVLVFFIFWPFMSELTLAAILAVVFQPLYKKIISEFKGRETLAASMVMLVIAVFLFIPLTFIAIQLVSESQSLYGSIVNGNTNYLSAIQHSLEEPLHQISPTFNFDVSAYVDGAFSWVINNIGVFVSGTAKTLFNIMLVAVAFYFFLKDGSKFKKSLLRLSPLDEKFNRQIEDKLEMSIRSVVKGTLLIAVMQGTLAALGFYASGISNVVLWGVVASVAAFIPGVGTAVITVPAIIYLFFIGHKVAALGLFVWSFLIVGTVDNLVRPYLFGKDINIHPLIVFFAVLGGLVFFGPMGFLFGPIAVSLFFALIRIYTIMIMHLEEIE